MARRKSVTALLSITALRVIFFIDLHSRRFNLKVEIGAAAVAGPNMGDVINLFGWPVGGAGAPVWTQPRQLNGYELKIRWLMRLICLVYLCRRPRSHELLILSLYQ